jgi:phage recombination protein Bet
MATTDIVTTPTVRATGLTISDSQTSFNDVQRAQLQHLGLADAPEGDIVALFHYAKRTGLDPFSRQIYMIGRRKKTRDGSWVAKYTIQIGIDGFRLVASRAARAAGLDYAIDEPDHPRVWCGPDGQWCDVWVSKEPPIAARVTVRLGDARFTHVAHLSESQDLTGDGKPMGLWARMPAHMLAKCAEAGALRKAFPADLSGIYLEEEMPPPVAVQGAPAAAERSGPARIRQQLDPPPVEAEIIDVTDTEELAPPITAKTSKAIKAAFAATNMTDPREIFQEISGLLSDANTGERTVTKIADLTEPEGLKVLAFFGPAGGEPTF